jgi:hypothetical protein
MQRDASYSHRDPASLSRDPRSFYRDASHLYRDVSSFSSRRIRFWARKNPGFLVSKFKSFGEPQGIGAVKLGS